MRYCYYSCQVLAVLDKWFIKGAETKKDVKKQFFVIYHQTFDKSTFKFRLLHYAYIHFGIVYYMPGQRYVLK